MLTSSQQLVEDQAVSIIKSGSRRLLIKGSAGVGKTYMMNSFLKRLQREGIIKKMIYCAAPTNKAVAVLKGKVHDLPDSEFITLHSALKMKRFIDDKTGDPYFKPSFSDRNKPFKGVGLIAIDEGSMVGEKMLQYTEQHADQMNVIVVFIADHKQLNPVKEDVSPIFNSNFPEVELTEIIRQGKGNPIIDLSRDIKSIWEYEDNMVEGIGYHHSVNAEKVIQRLAAVNGTDELKYLGYTNQDVDSLNRAVRERIYGTPRKVEPGESLIFNSPYKDQYFTNQEIKVETVNLVQDTFTIPYQDRQENIKFDFYVINGKQVEDHWMGVYVIHEKHEKELRKIAAITKKACLSRNMTWKDRDQFLTQFADIKYNHAITVHKSQGSTYKDVILNITNLSINRNEAEKQRLFYTGITRASDSLTLLTKK